MFFSESFSALLICNKVLSLQTILSDDAEISIVCLPPVSEIFKTKFSVLFHSPLSNLYLKNCLFGLLKRGL